MPIYNVRILEPWNGYKPNSELQLTHKAYYEARSNGVKMNIIADSAKVKPKIEKKLGKK